jgi:preprotein translocase subunit SecA
MRTLLKKVFGSRNDRVLHRLEKIVLKINALEASLQGLCDADLKAKTGEFKRRLVQGQTLDALLPEAFAVVREVSRRTLGMRHFDVQLIGGMVLHEGNIAEMLTGEGKTLSSTLPVYLNALSGRGVHVVTVNDYLAERDANWMRPVYTFLGMTVGVNKAFLNQDSKRAVYQCDIVYGTNNEFGFDYLRDNMAFSLAEQVQRELNFAVIDEVDSILIDEARTPLIISGAAEDSSELYLKMNQIIPKLVLREKEDGPGDYYLDEKHKQAFLTEAGHQTIENLLEKAGILQSEESLYSPANIVMLHHLNAALRAHKLYQRDIDYIVQNNEIIIVDEHTGRTMPGRRWSDGLHQAVEAKECVAIQKENQTLATITFQNFFRLYEKLSGMTGTADTEAYEFQHIYGLEVVAIPSNQKMIRRDQPDFIYFTKQEKFKALIDDVKAKQASKQPILLGTASIETSEYISALLKKENIAHEVLNAKQHAREAEIIAQAGKPGALTIATNMAGRGTDIVLGGGYAVELAALGEAPSAQAVAALRQDWEARHAQVLAAGGLYVIGSERHESRRIDNQLRGRSGRQGDPGETRFYLSLQDDLMRIFAADRIMGILKFIGMKEGDALEDSRISRIIEGAQKKVEAHNFDIRKQLLEYDDVANDQRRHIYELRHEVMKHENLSSDIQAYLGDVVESLVGLYVAPQSLEEQWDLEGLENQLLQDFKIVLDLRRWLKIDEHLHDEKILERVKEVVQQAYQAQNQTLGETVMHQLERSVVLYQLDLHWKEHIASMDHLRQGIHLRGYAQKNPKQEYKRESFELFSTMLDRFKYAVITTLVSIRVSNEKQVADLDEQRRYFTNQDMAFTHPSVEETIAEEDAGSVLLAEVTAQQAAERPFVRDQPKVGRNDPCPCGSGQKYKQCHGKLT